MSTREMSRELERRNNPTARFAALVLAAAHVEGMPAHEPIAVHRVLAFMSWGWPASPLDILSRLEWRDLRGAVVHAVHMTNIDPVKWDRRARDVGLLTVGATFPCPSIVTAETVADETLGALADRFVIVERVNMPDLGSIRRLYEDMLGVRIH